MQTERQKARSLVIDAFRLASKEAGFDGIPAAHISVMVGVLDTLDYIAEGSAHSSVPAHPSTQIEGHGNILVPLKRGYNPANSDLSAEMKEKLEKALAGERAP